MNIPHFKTIILKYSNKYKNDFQELKTLSTITIYPNLTNSSIESQHSLKGNSKLKNS
jgi:hypothetical protein